MLCCDLGTAEYTDVHRLQKELVASRIEGRLDDVCLIVEHPPVLTLGKRGGQQFLRVSEELLAMRGISLVQTERGGVITCHGPGQIVIYPLLHLRSVGLSVTEYVTILEETMIRVCGDFGVVAGRDARNAGAWIGENKIGSVGIGIRRGVTWHGLALNVNMDMTLFDMITPCGVSDIGATSLGLELDSQVDIEKAKTAALQHLFGLLGVSLEYITRSSLSRRGEVGE